MCPHGASVMGKGTGPHGGQVKGEGTRDVHGRDGGKPAWPLRKGSSSELEDRANEQAWPGKGSFHVLLWTWSFGAIGGLSAGE